MRSLPALLLAAAASSEAKGLYVSPKAHWGPFEWGFVIVFGVAIVALLLRMK